MATVNGGTIYFYWKSKNIRKDLIVEYTMARDDCRTFKHFKTNKQNKI